MKQLIAAAEVTNAGATTAFVFQGAGWCFHIKTKKLNKTHIWCRHLAPIGSPETLKRKGGESNLST